MRSLKQTIIRPTSFAAANCFFWAPFMRDLRASHFNQDSSTYEIKLFKVKRALKGQKLCSYVPRHPRKFRIIHPL